MRLLREADLVAAIAARPYSCHLHPVGGINTISTFPLLHRQQRLGGWGRARRRTMPMRLNPVAAFILSLFVHAWASKLIQGCKARRHGEGVPRERSRLIDISFGCDSRHEFSLAPIRRRG